MALESGMAMGPYRVIRRLGAGGMGEVYVAQDPRLGREVAIKVLPADLVRDHESLKRFQQECLAVAALNHPNILHIYDVGTAEDDSPYLVMELLEGESLRSRMAQKPMPVRKVAAIAAQLARALGAAHTKGIVHRDLKPENVFLTRQGPAKVLDFGLAKLAPEVRNTSGDEDATRALRTQAGMMLGTLGYMSPEQVQGHDVDGRADLFALGVVMWEMLSGSRPFKGDSAIDTMHAILRQETPEIPQELGLPPAMERILHRCLEKDPDARFQSAQDLAFQLDILAEASGMSRAEKVEPVEELAVPWHRRLHRYLYPLPIRLPARLKVCFWDRLQLTVIYAAILVGAALAWTGVFQPAFLGRSETDKSFVPVADSKGIVQSAAISWNGQHLVFAVQEGDGNLRLFHREGQDARSAEALENPPATQVLAVSDTGSVLLKNEGGYLFQMDLGRNSSAMQVGTRVLEADLSPDGTRIAVLRKGEDGYTLEYPQGQICHRSREKLFGVRVSPSGDRLAFLEREPGTMRFQVKVWHGGRVESWPAGGPLSPRGGFSEFGLRGMAWNKAEDGLFMAVQRNLIGLQTRKGETVLHRNAGSVSLFGSTADGPLLKVGTEQVIPRGRVKGQDGEPDLTWAKGVVQAVSDDGSSLLVAQDGEIWVMPSNRSMGRKIALGEPEDLSGDGKQVLYTDAQQRLIVMSSEGGDPRVLATLESLKGQGIDLTGESGTFTRFSFTGDGRWVLISSGPLLFRMRSDGTGSLEPVALAEAGPVARMGAFQSVDGRVVAYQESYANDAAMFIARDSANRSELGRVPAQEGERLVGWNGQEFLLFFSRQGRTELRFADLKGQRRVVRGPEPSTSGGRFTSLHVSPDGAYFTYRHVTEGISQLLLAKGLE